MKQSAYLLACDGLPHAALMVATKFCGTCHTPEGPMAPGFDCARQQTVDKSIAMNNDSLDMINLDIGLGGEWSLAAQWAFRKPGPATRHFANCVGSY
jgi:hypothetical protein